MIPLFALTHIMVELSIVTGTYNRLSSLQRMVASARASMGEFYNYEFVVVDGGSKDGTIAWCKAQPDITLIEQGKLYGAVKAFNAGAYAARGRYVILANDDITFMPQGIIRAIVYMDEHRHCGIGCFYQDRDGLPWHVSQMKAVAPNGTRTSVYYGQVCIVPKWLGDDVGWWGNYLHTYGGDNELSCMVVERGYTIDPVYDAKIMDGKVDDELRRINNDAPRPHPDTVKWMEKWPNGPRIPASASYNDDVRRLRVLYMPLFEPGNAIQRHNKIGLRAALERKFTTLQFDYHNRGIRDLMVEAAAFKPQIILTQIQDANAHSASVFTRLRRAHPDALMLNWNGDYHPENLYNNAYVSLMREYDLSGYVTTEIADLYDAYGVNWWYWQIGYEVSEAEPDSSTPHHDVVYLGNGYNAARIALGQFLYSLRGNGWDVGIYGNWQQFRPNGSNLYNFDEGQKLYRASKFAVSCQQYQNAVGYVSNRMFQAMASGGCMVLQQQFPGMSECIGVVDGEHLATWRDFSELQELIEYYSTNEAQRASIARQGSAYIRANYSFDAQVDKLIDKLYQAGYLE